MKFKSTANYKIACHIFHIHISINLFLWGTKIYLFFKLRSYFFLEAKVRCFLHSNKQSLTLSIFRIHILRIHSPKTKQQRKYALKGKKKVASSYDVDIFSMALFNQSFDIPLTSQSLDEPFRWSFYRSREAWN